MDRFTIKITGAQGQGVNSVGEAVGKGLKRSGYCVFGYREYMSLIKGGHSSYQLDVSNKKLNSTHSKADILVCFNHHGLEQNTREVAKNGIILHQTADWKYSRSDKDWLKKNKVTVVYLPVQETLRRLHLPPILGNMLITATVWYLLGKKKVVLRDMVQEQFGHKGERIVNKNYLCIDEAFTHCKTTGIQAKKKLPKASAKWKQHLILTGSQAMGLGVVHAGCRVYVGYPMTPSSPLLNYIAEVQNHTGMVIKQAEDEITAAQMMSGANFMGTRSLTATSGGGFDLMTETLSLNAMIENPSVIVLAQRPGPATGLPTWTGQGDLSLAVYAGHGEFTRLVMSVSDSEDAFALMNEAFNYAEEFQIPVTVLTDKQIAEAIFTQEPYNQKQAKIRRGKLVTSKAKLKALKATDRYSTKFDNGVSKRWLPGSKAATYCAQGDEHNEDGSVDETSANAIAQMDKRNRKLQYLKAALPEPELFGSKNPDVVLIGWGSTKGPVVDWLATRTVGTKLNIGYLHYTYLWPLHTKKLIRLLERGAKPVMIEGNYNGQLANLLQQELAPELPHRILKYDGRPFFVDELNNLIKPFLRNT